MKPVTPNDFKGLLVAFLICYPAAIVLLTVFCVLWN